LTITESTPVKAHSWQREAQEHYVEPFWCSERLFAVEDFGPGIWDPCCGFGRIPDSATKAGLYGIGTDVADRGWRDFAGVLDFLATDKFRAPNIVCNPPFNIAGRFCALAISRITRLRKPGHMRALIRCARWRLSATARRSTMPVEFTWRAR
jgi:hypothetical protein